MSESSTLGSWLRRYLTEHIVSERNLARNTQRSYRDCFVLLVAFLSAKVGRQADRLHVDDLTAARVLEFLTHLEQERGCSVQTRNQRLNAIRAFARFVGSRDPARLEWCGQIRAIATKRARPEPISWLTKQEMEALLAVPQAGTARGLVERGVLLFLCNTGARVSEATGLHVGDLAMGVDGRHALATLHGKGGKIRQVPLWPRTAEALARLVEGREPGDAVFLSRHRRPYTRFGVYRLVERCAARVPSLAQRKITPHVLRHTTACQLVQAGIDLNTIRAWLGHVSLDTTNVYAEIDLETKARAMELCEEGEPGPGEPWKQDKGLIAFLNAL